jgi:hypothetical protein
MNDNDYPIIDLEDVSSTECFGTWEEILAFEKEQKALWVKQKPQIKEMARPEIVFSGLPYKRNPALDRKDFTAPVAPTNVGLPRKKLPWVK